MALAWREQIHFDCACSGALLMNHGSFAVSEPRKRLQVQTAPRCVTGTGLISCSGGHHEPVDPAVPDRVRLQGPDARERPLRLGLRGTRGHARGRGLQPTVRASSREGRQGAPERHLLADRARGLRAEGGLVGRRRGRAAFRNTRAGRAIVAAGLPAVRTRPSGSSPVACRLFLIPDRRPRLRTRLVSWSMAKCVTSLLVGTLVGREKLSIRAAPSPWNSCCA